MNGNRTFWILGALGVGVAYLLWSKSATAGEREAGGGTGDASGGGASGTASGTDSGAVEGIGATLEEYAQSIGERLGIVAPKGERNHNPGNLRYVPSIQWVGQVGDDGTGYAVFDSDEHGIRALGHQLRTYLSRGINTVASIISTFAPSSENDTRAYIVDVANRLGADPNQPLDAGAIPVLAQAIIIHEEGEDIYGIANIAAWATES